MKEFVIASANADKTSEIVEVLEEEWGTTLHVARLEVDGTTCFVVGEDQPPSVPEVSEAPDVRETGATLEENASIKARGWASVTGLPAMADDTGLFVDALGGAPGVYSARFAGPNATYAQNVAKLIGELDGVADGERSARFATVAVWRAVDGTEVVGRGEVSGRIIAAARGSQGFGYDPVFVPSEGDGRTFAEMSAADKHACSHRGRAFRVLARELVAAEH